MKTSLRRLRVWMYRRLAGEHGVALVLVLLVMGGLTITTGSVLYFTSTSARSSSRTSADQQAYSLAEAGINTAIAKIYGASDPRLTSILPAGTVADPAVVVPRCSTGSNANETPSCYSTGSVSFSGTLDTSQGNTWYWTVKSTGSVPNPGGGQPVVRKLTRSVGVTGNNGTNGSSWTRFYQDSTSKCLTIDGVSVPTNFASRGDVCLVNGATITGSTTNINAGGRIYVDPPQTKNSGSESGWNSSGNASLQDSYTANSGALDNTQQSTDLLLTGYGYQLPSSATVRGIAVTVTRRASNNSSSVYVNDYDVQLRRSGADVGSDKALTTTKWPTTEASQTYGGTTDLWGTAWTASNINSSTFGVRLRVKGTCGSTNCVTAYVNSITITVYYSTAAGIGSSATPISEIHTGNGCQLELNSPSSPCTSAQRVYGTTVDSVAPADNPTLSMPDIDWQYWWENAKPGPKHFCTNANPGLSTSFFDNNAGWTTGPDRSLTVNGDMAIAGRPYNCEVWEDGVLKGRLAYDGAHRMDIYWTIFVDGSFRFDDDGLIIHYFGRATIMSSRHDEIDALVCAGGTGNTYATSCLANMSNWAPSQNMMVLMSQEDNEYDQGGTWCSGSPPSCYGGKVPAGFQGILYSTADCMIHQNFQDSGPVICNTITLPNEGYNPTYWPFPSVGNLTDGMSYSDTASATDFTINVSAQGDG